MNFSKSFLIFCLTFFSVISFSQIPILKSEIEIKDKSAENLYNQKLYEYTYDLLLPYCTSYVLIQNIDKNLELKKIEQWYYFLSSALKIDKLNNHQTDLENFVSDKNIMSNKSQRLSYDAGNYFYAKENYNLALAYFEKSNFEFLSEDEIIDKKFKMGYAYMLKKDFNQAILQFESIKDFNNETRDEANYYYAILALNKSKYEQALQSFKSLETNEKFKNNIPNYIALCYYKLNQKTNCINYIKSIINNLNIENKNDIMALLAQCYFDENNLSESANIYEELKKNNFEFKNSDLYNYGYALYSKNQLSESIEILKNISDSKDSINLNADYIMADCYLQKNDINNAANYFEKVSSSSLNSLLKEPALISLIKCEFIMKNYSYAKNKIQEFKKNYAFSDKNIDIKNIEAQIFLIQNEFKKGLALISPDDLKISEDIKKVYSVLSLNQGIEELKSNNLPNAKLNFENSINIKPKNNEASVWLAEISARDKNWENVLDVLTPYSSNHIFKNDINLTEYTALYNSGLAKLKLTNYNEALQIFSTLNEKNISFTNNNEKYKAQIAERIADCYLGENNYSKAKEWYSTSNNIVENNYSTFSIAQIEGLTNNIGKKKAELNKITNSQNEGDKFNAIFELGLTFLVENNFTKAKNYFIQSKDYSPLASKSLLNIGLCDENLKNINDAVNQYKKIISNYPLTDESELAKTQLENIYLDNGNIEEYENLMSGLANNSLSTNKIDSLSYMLGEKRFFTENYTAAQSYFKDYISKFPNGLFINSANYYEGVSLLNLKKYRESIPYFEYNTSNQNNSFYLNSIENLENIYKNKIIDTEKQNFYLDKLINQDENKEIKINALEKRMNDCIKKSDSLCFILNYNKYINPDIEYYNLNLENKKFVEAENDLNNKNYSLAKLKFESLQNSQNTDIESKSIYYYVYCLLKENQTVIAEKYLLEKLNNPNISEYWNLKYYLLLSDIFVAEKDFFNARETLKSLVNNASLNEIKKEAQYKLNLIKDEK